MVKLMGYLFNISAELDIDQWPSLDWVSDWAYLEIFLLHNIQLLNQVTYSFIYNWTPATFTFAISGNLCARFWSRPIISLWLSYLGIKKFLTILFQLKMVISLMSWNQMAKLTYILITNFYNLTQFYHSNVIAGFELFLAKLFHGLRIVAGMSLNC